MMTARDRILYVLCGTASLHVLIAVALASVEPPPRKKHVTAEVEILPPAREDPPPPPPPVLQPPTPPPVEPEATPPTRTPEPTPPRIRAERPPVAETTTTTTDDDVVTSGSAAPTLKMEDLAPQGIAVGSGKTTKRRHGSGDDKSTGNGTGSGAGSGTGSGSPPPVSVASIKTRAKPTGDYNYFDAGKEYPEEARRLEIQGQIKVRLTVSAKGKVTASKLLSKLGHGLDELAMARANKLEFEPALDTDDRPVASIVVWTFTFALPD